MKKYFWKKTKTPGVRYREHPTRKNGVKFDKYFTIRYNINGKTKEEALGWETQGWTEKKAAAKLSELREAQRTGVGAKTLSEKRKIAKDRAEQEALEQEIIKKENITFSEVFEKYITQAHQDKCNKTCIEEQGAYNKWIKPLCGHISLEPVFMN